MFAKIVLCDELLQSYQAAYVGKTIYIYIGCAEKAADVETSMGVSTGDTCSPAIHATVGSQRTGTPVCSHIVSYHIIIWIP